MGKLSSFIDLVEELVRMGFPEGTANKIATGELPMDEASRMARADEQGYTKDLFHSTYDDVSYIDQDKVDLGLHMGGDDQATQRLRQTADRRGGHRHGDSGYAEGANIMPLKVRQGRVIEAPDVGMWNDSERVIANTPMWGNGGLHDEAIDLKNSFETVPDWHDSPENRELLDEIRDNLGADTIKYKNEVESTYTYKPEVQQRRAEIGDDILNIENKYERPELPYPGATEADIQRYVDWKLDDVMSDDDKALIEALKGESMDISRGDDALVDQYSYIATDPGNVRSRFAAFDPDNEGVNNLLGSMAGAGVVGASALGSEDADAGVINGSKKALLSSLAGGSGLVATADKWAAPVNDAAEFVFDALEVPVRGWHGIAGVLGELARSGDIESALANGGKYASQSIDDTASDYGRAVADETGSPLAAALTHALTQMANPI